MELDSRIEAVLFFKSEPVSLKKLAEILAVTEEAASEALLVLENKLAGRGIRLMRANSEIALATAPEAGELVESLVKEDQNRDLGKAGLETLAIVAYQGPIARSQIDYIRGVNSSAIVRNLMVRGLIERVANPDDSRSFLYQPTMDLLQNLGLTKLEQLPEFETFKTRLEAIAETSDE
ncbi:MAG TPA: SMC-Scp complex subunit ScpB [Candidatus Paceibacterota bacterium]|nr:SMC-Scp complex subunit ScpB [Candidatus Paceibacterota bacterium]